MTVDQLLQRFAAQFGDPKTDDMETFFETYRDRLDGFSEDIISKACGRIIDHHTFPTWPTVGECHKAMREIADSEAIPADKANYVFQGPKSWRFLHPSQPQWPIWREYFGNTGNRRMIDCMDRDGVICVTKNFPIDGAEAWRAPHGYRRKHSETVE
jgi:hypothetical protein